MLLSSNLIEPLAGTLQQENSPTMKPDYLLFRECLLYPHCLISARDPIGYPDRRHWNGKPFYSFQEMEITHLSRECQPALLRFQVALSIQLDQSRVKDLSGKYKHLN